MTATTQRPKRRWTASDVPDQSGRIAVVTGASAGLGRHTASVLAARGATVVLACRDLDKARRVASRIRATAERVRVVRLDLASLASVRAAAEEIRSTCPRLDLLINNAGVMDVAYQRTVDGFELTFATNHLGHYALTGLVLDRLVDTPGSRIVTVSSLAHRRGVIDVDDLDGARNYVAAAAYARSKLANLLFTYELDARLRAARVSTVALAAHPGNARTELWRASPWLERALITRRLRAVNFWLAHDVSIGALATLRAAVDPSARGGELYGPSGRLQYTGYPVPVVASARAREPDTARRLWEVSERLTGVAYRIDGRRQGRSDARPG